MSWKENRIGGYVASSRVESMKKVAISKKTDCRTMSNGTSRNTSKKKPKCESEAVIDKKILLEPVVVLHKLVVENSFTPNNINSKPLLKRPQKPNKMPVAISIPHQIKMSNRKPVVMLHRIDEIIPSAKKVSPRQNGHSCKRAYSVSQDYMLQPVVMLENICDEISANSNKMLARKEDKPTVFHDCYDRKPIVLLVDIFENLYSHAKRCRYDEKENGMISLKLLKNQAPPSLEQRGLQDIKLSEIAIQPCTQTQEVINVELITRLLVAAVSLGNAPSRHNRPFDLTNPGEECQAIVEALWVYAWHVPPKETVCLFYSNRHHSRNGKLNNINVFSFWQQNETKIVRGRTKKDWIYVSTLDKSDFLSKITSTPETQEQFEKKMVSIMKASLGVDPYNWTLSEVGYIIGFWLAKLYNAQGINDEDLPKELVLAKEHFLDLYSWNYDVASVVK